MDEFFETNRNTWNDIVDLHVGSRLYDVDGFKQGQTSLRSIELDEMGDVNGRSLLHIQCHFGLDTLSWARLGANVTGTDLSDVAIDRARGLATELDIPARFVVSNTYDLPETLAGERFERAFLSYGAVIWLPDMDRLARVIASLLAPGGSFYMVEFHPLWGTFGDDGEPYERSYFHRAEPDRWEDSGDYAEPGDTKVRISYEWQHPVANVVSALCKAGLRIDFLHEFDWNPYAIHSMKEVEPGKAMLERWPGKVPLTYSIKATLPG